MLQRNMLITVEIFRNLTIKNIIRTLHKLHFQVTFRAI